MNSGSEDRIQALLSLILDIDLRIFEALLAAWQALDGDEEAVAVHMRLAYGQGYVDALTRRGEAASTATTGSPSRSASGRDRFLPRTLLT